LLKLKFMAGSAVEGKTKKERAGVAGAGREHHGGKPVRGNSLPGRGHGDTINQP